MLRLRQALQHWLRSWLEQVRIDWRALGIDNEVGRRAAHLIADLIDLAALGQESLGGLLKPLALGVL